MTSLGAVVLFNTAATVLMVLVLQNTSVVVGCACPLAPRSRPHTGKPVTLYGNTKSMTTPAVPDAVICSAQQHGYKQVSRLPRTGPERQAAFRTYRQGALAQTLVRAQHVTCDGASGAGRCALEAEVLQVVRGRARPADGRVLVDIDHELAMKVVANAKRQMHGAGIGAVESVGTNIDITLRGQAVHSDVAGLGGDSHRFGRCKQTGARV